MSLVNHEGEQGRRTSVREEEAPGINARRTCAMTPNCKSFARVTVFLPFDVAINRQMTIKTVIFVAARDYLRNNPPAVFPNQRNLRQ
jgi:hypothetical protein